MNVSRPLAIAAVAALLLARIASAGDWQPDPSHHYAFEVGTGPAETLRETDLRWARSLVANLERRGGTVTAFDHGIGGIPVDGPGVDLRFDERVVSWQ